MASRLFPVSFIPPYPVQFELSDVIIIFSAEFVTRVDIAPVFRRHRDEADNEDDVIFFTC